MVLDYTKGVMSESHENRVVDVGKGEKERIRRKCRYLAKGLCASARSGSYAWRMEA